MSRLTTVLGRGCAAIALLLGLVSAAPPTAQAVVAERATSAGTYAHQAASATNRHRVAQDLKKLKRTKCIQRFAVKQAKAMAAQRRMFHQSLGPVLSACGLSRVGENVAYGFGSGRSVVNRGWMRSAGHRANILDRRYRLMGIAARKGSDGHWYVAQVFGRKR